MTDKELIELAAKAAGITGYRYSEGFGCMGLWNESDGGWFDACGLWDPLRDDGDALRLAVKLGIEFHMEGDEESECVWANEIFEWTDGCALSVTRRAITRAAAQIGKEME